MVCIISEQLQSCGCGLSPPPVSMLSFKAGTMGLSEREPDSTVRHPGLSSLGPTCASHELPRRPKFKGGTTAGRTCTTPGCCIIVELCFVSALGLFADSTRGLLAGRTEEWSVTGRLEATGLGALARVGLVCIENLRAISLKPIGAAARSLASVGTRHNAPTSACFLPHTST